MKLLVIGCGQCGGRIADEFALMAKKAHIQSGLDILTNVLAVNTDVAAVIMSLVSESVSVAVDDPLPLPYPTRSSPSGELVVPSVTLPSLERLSVAVLPCALLVAEPTPTVTFWAELVTTNDPPPDIVIIV